MTDFSYLQGKKVCVALSGGVDSVCLFHQLLKERQIVGFSLCAVHCEHGIRGEESKGDMAFVTKLCQSASVPLIVYEEDCVALAKTQKISLETAARNFRKSAFEKALTHFQADCIATAHHLGDEAETVLFRLARGTSLTGVKGMSEKEEKIVRPLLNKSKQELLRYAEQNGLRWREDKTNAETDATRNKLRLNVLPKLEEAVSGASENLVRFSRIAAEDDEYLYRLSERLLSFVQPTESQDSGIRIAFCKEKPLFRRAFLTALKRLGVEKDYTLFQLERAYELQSLQTGKKASVLAGVEAVKTYDGIALYKSGVQSEVEEWEGVIAVEPFKQPRFGKTLKADGDQIPENVEIRTYREGDIFQKFGGGRKSLKKYFIDEKIPLEIRKKIPLLAEKNGNKIYAVFGVEISNQIKITETTKNTVYLYIQKKEKGEENE